MFNKPEKNVFDTLLEAISEAAIVVDEFQKIKEVNSSTIEMFGYNEVELIGKSIDILIPKKHKKRYVDYVKSLFIDQKKKKIGEGDDLYVIDKNSTVFSVEMGLSPFKILEDEYVMILIVDISLRKQKDIEIARLNNELKSCVEEQTRNLNATVERLQKENKGLDKENKRRVEVENEAKITLKRERELNELKTKFLSMVSHEFKTPLTGISISTMLLKKYNLTEQQKNREKYVAIINSKVHYLNSILNNFLSIEKLEKKEIRYDITTFYIKDVVDEVIDASNLLFKEGQEIVCISNFDEISMHQDRKIIELTLSNLVNNAIKYSLENTKIFIAVAQDDKNIIIRVIDKGFGIPEKDQKNIFKRYFRAENVLLIEGTGIGLNIIKTHLKNLGGKISFKSKQNIGTTFTVTIPNKFN